MSSGRETAQRPICLIALRAPVAGQSERDAGDWVASATQAVLAHGGSVARASAQALEASFASGPRPEDSAERALRCAQAMLAQAQATGRGWPGAGSLRLGVHGAATGPVAHAEPGLVVRQAAAIARWAPPGRLCIPHDLLALVRGLFDVEPPLPLVVEGRALALQVCLLRDAAQLPGAYSPRGVVDLVVDPVVDPVVEPAPPLVGRDDDMRMLQAAFGRLVAGGGARALTVLAEPGIGKSRLLREFDTWAHARSVPLHSLRARATPGGQAQPFGLLGQLLFGFCQIDPSHPSEWLQARLELALVPWFLDDDGADHAERQVHLVAHLIGLDLRHSRHLQPLLADPAQIRQRALRAVALLLQRLSAFGSSPLLMLIEDLHWADNESLDSLDDLLQTQPDLALLIVSSGRPELAARRPAWAAQAGAHQRLDLGPLDKARSRRLAADLLGKLPEIPRALLDRVVKASDGNPYGIEERIKLLIDQGVIQASGEVWSVSAARWPAVRCPATLAGVLRARLDLVPPAERRTLQRASVIGPVFGAAALRALGGGVSLALPGLLRCDLALSLPAAGPGAATSFSFKHPLLQELVYASLTPRTRRALHARFAAWLVGLAGERGQRGQRTNHLFGQSAHHFEQAGEDLRAAEQHARAAEYAHQRYAADAVMGHAQRGLALLDLLPTGTDQRELRWRLLKARIRMLEVIGQRAQHRADLDALLSLADASGDDARRAEAHLGAAVWAMNVADFAAMKSSARLAMGCAARAGDQNLRLHAMRYFASANFSLGDWDAGQRLAHQCLAEARAHGLRDVEAFCTNTLSSIASKQRDPVAGLHWDEQTLTIWRELGDRSQTAISVCNIGESWLELGDATQARRHLEEGVRLARACGNRMLCGVALGNLSVLERRLGDGERAVALAAQAVDAAVATSALGWEMLARQQLGDAEQAIGRHAAAALTFESIQALALRHQLAEPPDALAGLASLALAQGQVPTALRHVLRLLELEADGAVAQGSLNPRRLALVCHRVLSSAGDSRALAWLQGVRDELLAVAATISDEALRDGFLNNIPDHRAILAAWALHEQELAAVPGSPAP